MTQPLQGRRIIVTGGATGIGAAAVQVLSEAGAGILATYHRTSPPERAGVKWVQCDVRDSGAVDDMVRGAGEALGGLDVLLHAAGLWQPGIPGQLTGEDIDFLVDTNLKATIFTNQEASDVDGVIGHAFGVSYSVNPRLRVGAEVTVESLHGNWSNYEGTTVYAGPAISYTFNDHAWIAVTPAFQLTNTEDEPKFEGRVIFGWQF